MVAVREVHAAEQQFGIVQMIFKLRLRLCRKQMHDRGEVIFLVEVEQDLTVMQVLYDDRLRLVPCERRKRR